MSPEQIRGGAPNPSWDIWALAVIVYEMLAGVRPFAAANSLDWPPRWQPDMWVRLTDRQPELPAALASLFSRAFSVDPAERPAGALVFMRSLEQAFDRSWLPQPEMTSWTRGLGEEPRKGLCLYRCGET